MIVEQFAIRHRDDGEPVLMASGEIDAVSRAGFRHALLRLVDACDRDATVDMRDVVFMDSSGIHELTTGREYANDQGKHFAVRPSAQVRRVLEIVGLLEWFNVEP
jgi:anti-anti-sigma factor